VAVFSNCGVLQEREVGGKMAVGYLTWVVLDQLDILQVRQLAVNETVD